MGKCQLCDRVNPDVDYDDVCSSCRDTRCPSCGEEKPRCESICDTCAIREYGPDENYGAPDGGFETSDAAW